MLSLSCMAAAAPAQAAPVASSPAPPTAPASTYVVKRGDNLAGIAKKLKVKLADLLATNAITVTSTIHPGDVLLVPGAAPAVASAAPPVGGPATTYVVRAGDALFTVASKHGVKLGALLKANKLKIDSAVHPGDTLIIPAGGTSPISPSTTAPGQATTQPTETGSASSAIETVIAFATSQLGKPWKFNTAGPDTFDCSGLTLAAYAEIDVLLPHQSAMQANRGTAVDWRTEPIRAGDLVFMFTTSLPDVIGHVGIAIDSKRWIHAPRSGDVVRLGMLPSADKIQAVRRFVDA